MSNLTFPITVEVVGHDIEPIDVFVELDHIIPGSQQREVKFNSTDDGLY